MLSPVEQACTLTLPLFIVSLDDLLLPNHDFQVAHTSFIKFYRLFDISRTHAPGLGHHHYLGLPPPSINWPPIPPPPTHHQTTTWPPIWHPQHWSPGVLCALLEWPCWALPSSP